MANQNSGPYSVVGYGLSQALPNIFPSPIVAKRSPTTNDTKYFIGQVWIYSATNSPYILTSVVSNSATWLLLEAGGGAGNFASVTSATFVTAGTTMTAGTGLTVTAGGATIGGNSTVTGTLGVTGVTTVNSGTAVTAGGTVALVVGGGATAPQILAGSGAPTFAAHQGSLYLRTDGSSVATRAYIAVDSAGTWTAITTVA
jgi:hypothetical protein